MRRVVLIPLLVCVLIAPSAIAASAVEPATGAPRVTTKGTPPDRIIDEQEPRIVKVTDQVGAGEQPPPGPREGTPVIPGGEEVPDEAAQLTAPQARGLAQLSAPLTSFDGGGGANPNDTTGDVGPNHFVQAINVSFRVYDKAGTLLEGPLALGLVWNDGDPNEEPCEGDAGDPVVLYDNLADRWMIAQFSRFPPFRNFLCLAVSMTADPRLSQGYYTYTFDMGAVPDYPKIGAWTDGYYFSGSDADEGSGALVAVFDRAKMLDGMPAGAVQFTSVSNLPNNDFNVLMPSDIDGSTAPPAGSPGYFYRPVDGDKMGGGADRVELFTATVNWADPPASTLSAPTAIPVVEFDNAVCGYVSNGCIPQPGASGLLDPVNELGMFRFPYRNYGDREVLAGNFTVDTNAGGADRAGVRWFVLERTGGGPWGVSDQGTFAPQPVGATAFVHRFMGSLAMDRFGNLALGYTRSSAGNPTSPGGYTGFASAVYTGRAAGDPAGLLPQPEFVVQDGTGALGEAGQKTRWGDYYTMVVDPVDDCTFWYTGDYATWYTGDDETGYPGDETTIRQSRIASFRFADCATDLRITKTVALSQIGAEQQADYTITVHNDGEVGAMDVVVTDPLPADVTYQSDTGSCTGAGTGATGTLTCALGNIAAGDSTSFEITVRINDNPGTAAITNTATVTSGSTESDASDNTASVTHLATGANLSLTASDAPDPVIAGENLSYTLTLGNAGPSTARDVVLTDPLPAGASFVDAVGGAGTTACAEVTSGVVSCSVGDLDPGQTVQRIITVKVSASLPAGSLTNTASASSPTDADGAEATAVTAVANSADLWIEKQGTPPAGNPSGPIVYRLTVHNKAGSAADSTPTSGAGGPSDAQSVLVVDTLPLTWKKLRVKYLSPGCVYNREAHTVTCAADTIPAGSSVTFEIHVQVNGSNGSLTNTAQVSSATADPSIGNNTDSVDNIIQGGSVKGPRPR